MLQAHSYSFTVWQSKTSAAIETYSLRGSGCGILPARPRVGPGGFRVACSIGLWAVGTWPGCPTGIGALSLGGTFSVVQGRKFLRYCFFYFLSIILQQLVLSCCSSYVYFTDLLHSFVAMTLRYICQCFMLVCFLSSYVCVFNFFFFFGRQLDWL